MSEKQTRKTRLYDRSQVISLINDENPRRAGSNRYLIFEAIRDGMTVDEFLAEVSEFNGGTKDLQLLEESGHVAVSISEQAAAVAPDPVGFSQMNT
jgi:hypothetical protein|tara:strand:- start:3465 stop:3752 length:288 start_codon:yes stop_codon:yes gene_type:complete